MTELPGVGVFGCNLKSEYLVKCLNKNGFKVKAIWSNSINQAKEFAKSFQIEFYTDKIDILLLKPEVQLILINCEQSHYVQIVTKAFRIGKHVLCDWPSNLTVQELNKMCDASAYYPSLISIYHSFPLRFLPQMRLMRNLILEQNFIGDITIINVNINGRSLIESDNLEQLIISQSNCIYCKKAKNGDEKLNEEKPTAEKTNENKEQSEFLDPNKIPGLSEKLKTKVKSKENKNGKNVNKKKTQSNLNKKIEINSLDNKRYNQIMKEGGLLSMLGPHVIDLLSFLTNLKAKKCNGILRTFNTSSFLNELSLIKRITVDDFCLFQMEMYKTQQAKATKTVNIDERPKDKQSNEKSFKSNKKVKELANNNPIAVVTLNDHLETMDKTYEILIGGEFGYLRLKNGNLFGKQYEQNNNKESTESELLNEEQAIYLVKNNMNLRNVCTLHQESELSKMVLSNNHVFKPLESGLEKLIESMKNAFDNNPCENLPAPKEDKTTNGNEKIIVNDKKETTTVIINNNQVNDPKKCKEVGNLKDQSNNKEKSKENQINDHLTIVQINNERNLINSIKVEPLKEKNLEINSEESKVNNNNNDFNEKTKINGKQNGQNEVHKTSDEELNNNLKTKQDKAAHLNGHHLNGHHLNGLKKILTNGTKLIHHHHENNHHPTFYINETSNCNSLNSDSLNTTSSLNSDSLNCNSLNSDLSINNSSFTSNSSTENVVNINLNNNTVNIVNNLPIDLPVKKDLPDNLTNKLKEDCTKEIDKRKNVEQCRNKWFKEAVNLASSFDDGLYVLSVIEAIRASSKLMEWTRVKI